MVNKENVGDYYLTKVRGVTKVIADTGYLEKDLKACLDNISLYLGLEEMKFVKINDLKFLEDELVYIRGRLIRFRKMKSEGKNEEIKKIEFILKNRSLDLQIRTRKIIEWACEYDLTESIIKSKDMNKKSTKIEETNQPINEAQKETKIDSKRKIWQFVNQNWSRTGVIITSFSVIINIIFGIASFYFKIKSDKKNDYDKSFTDITSYISNNKNEFNDGDSSKVTWLVSQMSEIQGEEYSDLRGKIFKHIIGTVSGKGLDSILKKVDFNSANLKGFIFPETIKFDYIKLSNANLSGAIFFRSDVRHADFTNANLSDADITWGNLTGSDLRGADLRGINLSATVFGIKEVAKLESAKVSSSDFFENIEKAHEKAMFGDGHKLRRSDCLQDLDFVKSRYTIDSTVFSNYYIKR